MAGVEAFTILAILDAKDRISGVIRHVDETLNQFTATSARAAEASRVSGTVIDQSLLQTASGANALQVANARLSASHARLALATQELAGAERELIAADEAAMRAAEGDAVALSRQAAAAERLAAAQQMVVRTTAEVAAAQSAQTATATAATAATTGGAVAAGRFSGAAATAGVALKTMGKLAMGAGLAAAAIGYESIKAATSFETLTMRLVTTAGESKANLETVRRGILDVSTSVGVSADEAAKGMYMIESAGYRGAEGIKVLRAVTEGAAIEGADFATVANAVTDVLKDYHWGAERANEATSTLIKAVSYGKTTFQNMSAAMANVLPLASSLHIKINDVTGVLAEMTAHGMTAQRASFNIANAMRSLAAPTKMMEKEFKLFGISSKEVQESLSTRGLGGTIQWLSGLAKEGAGDVGQTYNEALRKLMGNATSLQVALLTTGENAKGTNAAIKGIGEAANDASGHVHGFAELQATMAYKVDTAKAAIHNAGIAIGSALLPAVTRIAGVIVDIVTPIAGWIEKHEKLTAIVLGSLVGLGVLTAIVWSLATAVQVLLSPVTLVVIAIGLLVAGLIYAYKHFETFRLVVDRVGTFLKTVFIEAWKLAGKVINWFSDNVMPYVRKAIQALITWFNNHKDEFKAAWDLLVREVKKIAEWFNDNVVAFIKDRLNDLKKWWGEHGDQVKRLWKGMFAALKIEWKVTWDIIKAGLTVMKGVWILIWGILRDTVQTIWASISGIVKTQFHLLLNVIGVILDLINGRWDKAWKGLQHLVQQYLADMTSMIRNTVANFGNLLYNAGKNIVQGLINGIRAMAGGVSSAISDIVGGIKDHLPWSPAKKGPLSGSGAPEIGGRNIGKLMAMGIRDSAPQVEAAMAHITTTVRAKQALTASGAIVAGVSTGMTGQLVGAGGAGGTVLNFDLRGSQVMSDRDMDTLVGKIGRQIATRVLPAGGVRIRM